MYSCILPSLHQPAGATCLLIGSSAAVFAHLNEKLRMAQSAQEVAKAPRDLPLNVSSLLFRGSWSAIEKGDC